MWRISTALQGSEAEAGQSVKMQNASVLEPNSLRREAVAMRAEIGTVALMNTEYTYSMSVCLRRRLPGSQASQAARVVFHTKNGTSQWLPPPCRVFRLAGLSGSRRLSSCSRLT